MALITCAVLYIYDATKGGTLNRSARERRKEAALLRYTLNFGSLQPLKSNQAGFNYAQTFNFKYLLCLILALQILKSVTTVDSL